MWTWWKRLWHGPPDLGSLTPSALAFWLWREWREGDKLPGEP